MQATVHRFEPSSGAGSVVTDAGVLLPFDAAALAAGSLRHVRSGQRLTVVVEGSGAAARVVAVSLEGLGRTPEHPSTP